MLNWFRLMKELQQIAREEHIPVLIHVNELTQPQGHSTSGSHERYKNGERLAWERDFDCIRQMRLWMIAINIASPEELSEIEFELKKEVLEAKKEAWNSFINPIIEDQKNLLALLEQIAEASINHKERIKKYISELSAIKSPFEKGNAWLSHVKYYVLLKCQTVRLLLSSWITGLLSMKHNQNSAVIYILNQI